MLALQRDGCFEAFVVTRGPVVFGTIFLSAVIYLRHSWHGPKPWN